MGCGVSSDSSDVSQNNNDTDKINHAPKNPSPTPSAISYRKADNILAKQVCESQSAEILHATVNSNPNNNSSNAVGNCYINHSDSISSCGSSTTGGGIPAFGVGDAVNVAHVMNLAYQQQQQQLWKNGTSSATNLLVMMLNNNNNNNNSNTTNNTSNAEDIIAGSHQKNIFISTGSQDLENRHYHSSDPFSAPSSASNADDRAASPPNMSHTASHNQNTNVTNLFIGVSTSSNAGSNFHQNNNSNNSARHHQQYPSTDVGAAANNGISSCGGGGGAGAGGYFSTESKSRDSHNCSAVAPQPFFSAIHGVARETSEINRNNNNNNNNNNHRPCVGNCSNDIRNSYFNNNNESQPVPPSSSLGIPPSSTFNNPESQKVLNYYHNIFVNSHHQDLHVQMNGSNTNNNNVCDVTVSATGKAHTKCLSSNDNTGGVGIGGVESVAMMSGNNNNLVHQNSNNYNLSNQYLPSLSLNVSAQQASVSFGGNNNNNNNNHLLVGAVNQQKKKIDWEELDQKIPFSPMRLSNHSNSNNNSLNDQETLIRNQRRQLFDSFEISPSKRTSNNFASSSPLRISYANVVKGLSQHLKSSNVEEVLGYFSTSSKTQNSNNDDISNSLQNIIKMAFNTTKLAAELAAVCRESLAASAKMVASSDNFANSVDRAEFRLVLAYLRFYFELFQLFDNTNNNNNNGTTNDDNEQQEQFLPHSVETRVADKHEEQENLRVSSNSASATKPVTFEMFQRSGPILERWGIKMLDDSLEQTFKNIILVDDNNNNKHLEKGDQSDVKNLEVDFDEFAAWAMAQNLLALDQE